MARGSLPPFNVVAVVIAVLCAGLIPYLLLSGDESDGSGHIERTVGLHIDHHADFPPDLLEAWRAAYATSDPADGPGAAQEIKADMFTQPLADGSVMVFSGRRIGSEEIGAARRRDIEPAQWVVGYDVITVLVHADNPVASLSLKDLAAVYGESGGITRWADLETEIPGCASGEIVAIGHERTSGVSEYFRRGVVGKRRDLATTLQEVGAGNDVAEQVARTPCAIGYTSSTRVPPGTRAVPIRKDEAGPAVSPSVAAGADGSYPLARPLLLYTHSNIAGAAKAYVDWLLSDEGQRVAHSRGYVPIRKLKPKR